MDNMTEMELQCVESTFDGSNFDTPVNKQDLCCHFSSRNCRKVIDLLHNLQVMTHFLRMTYCCLINQRRGMTTSVAQL